MPKETPQVDPVQTEEAGEKLPLTKDPNADVAELQDALAKSRMAERKLRKANQRLKDQRDQQPEQKTEQPTPPPAMPDNGEAERWRLRALVAERAAGKVPLDLVDLTDADADDAEDLDYRITQAQKRMQQYAEQYGYTKAPPVPTPQPTAEEAAPVPEKPAPRTDTEGTPAEVSPLSTLEGRLVDAAKRMDEADAQGNRTLREKAIADYRAVRSEAAMTIEGREILNRVNASRFA